MTVRLYLDEDAGDKALVRALRARGVDVQPANEAGMIEHPDDAQLERWELGDRRWEIGDGRWEIGDRR